MGFFFSGLVLHLQISLGRIAILTVLSQFVNMEFLFLYLDPLSNFPQQHFSFPYSRLVLLLLNIFLGIYLFLMLLLMESYLFLILNLSFGRPRHLGNVALIVY